MSILEINDNPLCHLFSGILLSNFTWSMLHEQVKPCPSPAVMFLSFSIIIIRTPFYWSVGEGILLG